MTRARLSPATVGLVAAVLGACAHAPAGAPPPAPNASASPPVRWLCLPGRTDACSGDLTTTEIGRDGSRTVVPSARAVDPKVDCFYVYPTVDLELVPGNHVDFTDTTRMANTALAQVGHFAEACAVFAPLYRQVTLGTYLQPRERLEAGLSLAFSDVERAFVEYLARWDRGHEIVLVGHSQGADMVVRLVRKFFDGDPAMRQRLLYAMPIGGHVDDGTFANVPTCTKMGQTGCVVAYRSYARDRPVVPGRDAPPPGHTTACVSPGDLLGDGAKPLSRSIFFLTPLVARHVRGIDGVTTPFVALRDFYRASCVDGPDGFRYLAVDTAAAPGDARTPPLDLERDFPKTGLVAALGLHLVDFQLAQGELIELIRRAAPK